MTSCFLLFPPLPSPLSLPTPSPAVSPPSRQMSEIRSELDTLPMRAMLAAAFITYLSAAPEDRRRHCLESWMAQCGLQSEDARIQNSKNRPARVATGETEQHKDPHDHGIVSSGVQPLVAVPLYSCNVVEGERICAD